VEIYDLTGNPLIKSIVLNSLNIASLANGIYILKAEDKQPCKLIKSN
jgi:hypothetical protein